MFDYYNKKKKLKNFLGFSNIIISGPNYVFKEDNFNVIKKILIDSKLSEYILEIPDVIQLTIIYFNPNELLISLRQSELDDPFLLMQQIDFFDKTLPEHIDIFPYKMKKTVYKFKVKLNNYNIVY